MNYKFSGYKINGIINVNILWTGKWKIGGYIWRKKTYEKEANKCWNGGTDITFNKIK